MVEIVDLGLFDLHIQAVTLAMQNGSQETESEVGNYNCGLCSARIDLVTPRMNAVPPRGLR